MKQPKPVTIDFESFGIEDRPHYPPVPCGVSIKYPGAKSRYYAFGHLDGNNCTWGEARDALAAAYAWPDGILCQNGKFDVDVAEVHFELPVPKWDRIHDTMFLIFLDDPHQSELGLKPTVQRLFGESPAERDAVIEWLVEHQPVPGVKISRSKSSDHYAMKYLPFAPGGLVGEYANDDTSDTERVFNALWKKTKQREMLVPYDRERRLMPILLKMERRGLPVDLERLSADVQMYSEWFGRLDAWLRKYLKRGDDLNLDSGEQLMAAMAAVGKIDLDVAPRTATGKLASNKDALLVALKDSLLLALLKYRAQLKTSLGTFMAPWLQMALETGGTIHTTWNQVRSPKGDDTSGTRTGRLSATWFMNIPKEFKDARDGIKKLPKELIGLPALPNVRSYVVPGSGHVLIDRDYCFGPGTEVLTERGFVMFEELTDEDLVAQWDSGKITFDRPKAYQVTRYTGDLIHIVGERSTDLLVTPNHQCLLVKHHQTMFKRADEYDLSHTQQPHAGLYAGILRGVPESYVQLVASIQADATLKHGTTLAWKLKKQRKIERLKFILRASKIDYKTSNPPSAEGYTIIYVNRDALPNFIEDSLDLENDKTFHPLLRDLSPDTRLKFLEELAWWDGRRGFNGRHWSYFTTNQANADLVQELAVLTGLRAVASSTVLASRKVFTSISLRYNYLTWTKTYNVSRVPYDGPVYCVTMPCGTVIVRRNGRVCVTGNSQQEPRILAHFDGGALMRVYQANPWMDFHDSARDELAKVGKHYERKPVKNTNLGLIYGMGVGKLAIKNDMPVTEAKGLKDAILHLYPGLKELYADMRTRSRMNVPIRTWGGREIYCEPPRVVDGKMRQFDYKMVNMLIQGSAADCTKEAIIRWDARIEELGKSEAWFLLLNVHDQLTSAVPIEDGAEAMEEQRKIMESVEFDVQILSEGSVSFENWAALTDVDKKGVKLPWPKAPQSSRSDRPKRGHSAPTHCTPSVRRSSSSSKSSSTRSLPTPPWSEVT